LRVELVAVTTASSKNGRLVVTARLSGGRPGVRYTLSGGNCDATTNHPAWAAGTADAQGNADLAGPTWTVPTNGQYFLNLEPWHFTFPHTPVTGLAGFWLLGQANRIRVAHQPCL
jgi:hypothetical protein